MKWVALMVIGVLIIIASLARRAGAPSLHSASASSVTDSVQFWSGLALTILGVIGKAFEVYKQYTDAKKDARAGTEGLQPQATASKPQFPLLPASLSECIPGRRYCDERGRTYICVEDRRGKRIQEIAVKISD